MNSDLRPSGGDTPSLRDLPLFSIFLVTRCHFIGNRLCRRFVQPLTLHITVALVHNRSFNAGSITTIRLFRRRWLPVIIRPREEIISVLCIPRPCRSRALSDYGQVIAFCQPGRVRAANPNSPFLSRTSKGVKSPFHIKAAPLSRSPAMTFSWRWVVLQTPRTFLERRRSQFSR
jgi:hypothetical protein